MLDIDRQSIEQTPEPAFENAPIINLKEQLGTHKRYMTRNEFNTIVHTADNNIQIHDPHQNQNVDYLEPIAEKTIFSSGGAKDYSEANTNAISHDFQKTKDTRGQDTNLLS